MIIRILGLLFGLLCFWLPFAASADPTAWLLALFGIPFVAYGIGGQRWLAKVAPMWAETTFSNESTREDQKKE